VRLEFTTQVVGDDAIEGYARDAHGALKGGTRTNAAQREAPRPTPEPADE